MTRRNHVVLTLGGLALIASYAVWGADAPPNPYEHIIVRNTFALKPVPPPAPPAEAPKPPAPKVTLTGITTILGSKIVLLKSQATAKPGEPAKDGSYMLAEGEGQDGIHVLEINTQDATAKVDCFGDVQTLTLSLKPPSGGGGPAPGAPPATAGFAPPPVTHPNPSGGMPVTQGFPAAKPNLPTRPVRGNVGGPGAVGGQGAVGIPAPSPTYGITPLQGQTATTPQPSATQAPAPGTPMSAEESIIMMEVERELHKNDPKYPPLPPTPLNPHPGSPAPPAAPGGK